MRPLPRPLALALFIAFAPGGFVLATVLAARWLTRRLRRPTAIDDDAGDGRKG